MEKRLASNSNQNKQPLESPQKKKISKLTNNLYLKVAAVVIAIILWASVKASSDGIIDKKFVIPITYTNAHYLDEHDFALKDYADTITIVVKAKTSAIANMKEAHFTATADLSARIGDDPYRKLVQVQVTPHEDIASEVVDLTYKTSEWVNITLEPIQTKSFNVEVMTQGELPDGYQLSSDGFNIEPSSIVLRAPESSFSNINKVAVYVSLEQEEDGLINQTLQPVLLDSNNKVVLLHDGMSFDTESINVTTELLKSRKIPVIIDSTSGTLAEGYQLKGTSPNPSEITILGTLADLANVNSVIIPKEELNIDGLTADKEFAVDITKYLPETVSLYGDESVIRVVVSIEALDEKSYQISSDQIEIEGMLEGRNYEIRTKNVTVTLRGLEEDLASLEGEEIQLSVDVSSLRLGMNSKIPVTVQVRSGFTVMNSPTITLIITEIEESSTEKTEEASTSEAISSEETLETESSSDI